MGRAAPARRNGRTDRRDEREPRPERMARSAGRRLAASHARVRPRARPVVSAQPFNSIPGESRKPAEPEPGFIRALRVRLGRRLVGRRGRRADAVRVAAQDRDGRRLRRRRGRPGASRTHRAHVNSSRIMSCYYKFSQHTAKQRVFLPSSTVPTPPTNRRDGCYKDSNTFFSVGVIRKSLSSPLLSVLLVVVCLLTSRRRLSGTSDTAPRPPVDTAGCPEPAGRPPTTRRRAAHPGR